MTERSSERDCEVMMKNIVKGKSFGTGGEDYKKKGLRGGGEGGMRDKFNGLVEKLYGREVWGISLYGKKGQGEALYMREEGGAELYGREECGGALYRREGCGGALFRREGCGGALYRREEWGG